MKRFIFYLFLLLAAVWLGLKIKADPGYALFAYQHWTVEMPLWFAGFLIFLTYLAFYALTRLLYNTGTLGHRVKNCVSPFKRPVKACYNWPKENGLLLKDY